LHIRVCGAAVATGRGRRKATGCLTRSTALVRVLVGVTTAARLSVGIALGQLIDCGIHR